MQTDRATLMGLRVPTQCRQTHEKQCRINANRGPWQLFRPDINTAHFYIIVKKLNSLKHLVRTTAAESHN